MAYFFTICRLKLPKTKTYKFYPQHVASGLISVDTICQELAERSGHSYGQVSGLIQDYLDTALDHLHESQNVRFGPLGILRPTLSSHGSDTKEDANISQIKKVNVRFWTSPTFKDFVRKNKVTFKRYVFNKQNQ